MYVPAIVIPGVSDLVLPFDHPQTPGLPVLPLASVSAAAAAPQPTHENELRKFLWGECPSRISLKGKQADERHACVTVGRVDSSRSRASACASCALSAKRKPSHLELIASASSSACIDTAPQTQCEDLSISFISSLRDK